MPESSGPVNKNGKNSTSLNERRLVGSGSPIACRHPIKAFFSLDLILLWLFRPIDDKQFNWYLLGLQSESQLFPKSRDQRRSRRFD